MNFKTKAKDALIARAARLPVKDLVGCIEKELRSTYMQAYEDIISVMDKSLVEIKKRKEFAKSNKDTEEHFTLLGIEAWFQVAKNDMEQKLRAVYGD